MHNDARVKTHQAQGMQHCTKCNRYAPVVVVPQNIIHRGIPFNDPAGIASDQHSEEGPGKLLTEDREERKGQDDIAKPVCTNNQYA